MTSSRTIPPAVDLGADVARRVVDSLRDLRHGEVLVRVFVRDGTAYRIESARIESAMIPGGAR